MHGTLREGLCTFEALRKLGFEAGDVWVCCHLGGAPQNVRGEWQTDGPWMNVQLKAQGLEFTVGVGPLPEGTTEGSFEGLWQATCDAFIAASPEERDALWDASWICAHELSFVWGLLQRGFRLPAVEARKAGWGPK